MTRTLNPTFRLLAWTSYLSLLNYDTNALLENSYYRVGRQNCQITDRMVLWYSWSNECSGIQRDKNVSVQLHRHIIVVLMELSSFTMSQIKVIYPSQRTEVDAFRFVQ